jgi:hypothetical protein
MLTEPRTWTTISSYLTIQSLQVSAHKKKTIIVTTWKKLSKPFPENGRKNHVSLSKFKYRENVFLLAQGERKESIPARFLNAFEAYIKSSCIKLHTTHKYEVSSYNYINQIQIITCTWEDTKHFGVW